jgi:DNA modification methylase
MFEINAEVFRVIRPGSLYFYNIFDYFDNENIVALSAMGQKRVTLSAYTVDLFRRIGFQCIGNIAWDKGEIEGKRGFNSGNFSPFYQSPFNCWEHVLVFKKPGEESPDFGGSRILRAKPVTKMVKGKNVHGHTAPFPDEIPLLCIKSLPPNSVILDPFGGSLTTGRAAVASGRRAICIEQSREYCELGLSYYLGNIQMELTI